MDVAVIRDPVGEYELDIAGPGVEADGPDVRDFVAAHWAQLYRMAYFMTGNQQDAEDTAQTAMAVVVERLSRIERHDAPIVYARHVVATTVYRRTRRRRMELDRLGVASRDGGPATTADASQSLVRRDELLAALSQLPPRARAAVVMRHCGGMSEQETAAALGCCVGTVKSQTSKALARLRLVMTRTTQERTWAAWMIGTRDGTSNGLLSWAGAGVAVPAQTWTMIEQRVARRRRWRASARAATVTAAVAIGTGVAATQGLGGSSAVTPAAGPTGSPSRPAFPPAVSTTTLAPTDPAFDFFDDATTY